MKLLQIRVKPHARVAARTAQPDGSWLAQVTVLPIDGRANDAVIRLVAVHFGVRRAQVRIKSGASSHSKRVEIDD